jgi:hypothetical protein
MSWIEEYKLLEKENLELNVIRLLREKIDDISKLNEKYHLFLREIREVHLFENKKVQEYLIKKMFEKIFEDNQGKKVEKEEEKNEEYRFTMKKIEPVPSFYKKNIQLEWKIRDDNEDGKRVKRKFGEICVEKRREDKKENKKKMKR